jgi:hypothetical protein
MTLPLPASAFRASVPVTLRPDVYSLETKRFVMPEGLTLAEIASNVPDLPAEFWELGVIRVGSREIPRELWQRARPRVREGCELAVTLHMVPAGGQDVLQVLAQVALVGVTLGASIFLGPIAGAVAGIGGQLLLGLLFQPAQLNAKQPRPPIGYGVSANPAKPLEQLETVLGYMQASPPYLANPYSTLVGQDVFVEAVVGYAGNHDVSEVKVNGTDVADNETVEEWQVRGGYPADTPITIANKDAFEERPGQELTNFDLDYRQGHVNEIKDQVTPSRCDPQWHSFAMHGDGAVFKVRFLFPQGLLKHHDGSPDIDPAGIPIRMQFRKRGTVGWINGPEFHFYQHEQIAQELRQEIKILWDSGDTTVSSIQNDRHAYVVFWKANPGLAWEYVADSYFDPADGSLNAAHVVQTDDGYVVHLESSLFPPGEYETRWKRGLNYNWDFFSPGAYRYNSSAVEASFFDYFFLGGLYKVYIAESNFTTGCTVEAITTISNNYPLPLPDVMPLTIIAVKVKNGNIGSISATFKSPVNTWNGVDWSTYGLSNNPAALYRHVLKDSLNAKPLDVAIIDDMVLQSWYTDCVTRGLECNAIVADSVENVLKLIATAGWAIPRQNERWGVIVEHDRIAESIVQNFTPLNSKGFQAQKSFDDIPHAILAEFVSQDEDYTIQQRTIYGDGYDSTNATLFQQIRYDSITDPAQIDQRALMDWRQMRYRQTRRTIEIGAESLMSGRGDMVGLTHDVVGKKFFYGIVDAVLTSGGNVTGLRLQAMAELSQAGGACGVMVRLEDLTTIEAPINETGDTSVITFTTPFAIPANGVLCEGCLVGLGLVSQVYKRMLIFDIRPVKDLGARLTLIDEAPEIFTGPVGSGDWSLDFSLKKNSFYIPLPA